MLLRQQLHLEFWNIKDRLLMKSNFRQLKDWNLCDCIVIRNRYPFQYPTLKDRRAKGMQLCCQCILRMQMQSHWRIEEMLRHYIKASPLFVDHINQIKEQRKELLNRQFQKPIRTKSKNNRCVRRDILVLSKLLIFADIKILRYFWFLVAYLRWRCSFLFCFHRIERS